MLQSLLHKCLLYPVVKIAGLFMLHKNGILKSSIAQKNTEYKGFWYVLERKRGEKRCPREKNTKKLKIWQKKTWRVRIVGISLIQDLSPVFFESAVQKTYFPFFLVVQQKGSNRFLLFCLLLPFCLCLSLPFFPEKNWMAEDSCACNWWSWRCTQGLCLYYFG